jgi:transcriptional regulator with XRE-family HTH domain
LKVHFALADAVLRTRIERGWSQTELAERVGTKQANISRIESGLGNPTLNLLQKIIKVLELDINFSPAPSSTTYKAISFGQDRIPVDNWPVSQSSASNAQRQVLHNGEQK